jgi:hypothetical protein
MKLFKEEEIKTMKKVISGIKCDICGKIIPTGGWDMPTFAINYPIERNGITYSDSSPIDMCFECFDKNIRPLLKNES